MAAIRHWPCWLTTGLALVLVWTVACGGPSARPATTPSAVNCSVTIHLNQTQFNQFGGRTTLQITTSAPGCAWTVAAPPWITVDPAQGIGSGAAIVQIPEASSSRTGTIQVSGSSEAVTQTVVESVGVPLGIKRVVCGAFRAGTYAPLACYVVVEPATEPTSTDIRVFADLRAIGGREDFGLVRCIACGELGYEMDPRIPADVRPGPKIIPFTVTDQQGRVGRGSGTLEILAAAQ